MESLVTTTPAVYGGILKSDKRTQLTEYRIEKSSLVDEYKNNKVLGDR